jgi:lipoyl(octanoyl) transferase
MPDVVKEGTIDPTHDIGNVMTDIGRLDSGFFFRDLGQAELTDVWARMQRFTNDRGADTRDEVWFVEHPPVFTLGMNADRRHLLDPREIPVVETDRGGQVTYHGPGQIVAYVLLDLRRRGWSVRRLVDELEAAIVDMVAGYGVVARGSSDARGVYVGNAKLAALGLRVRRHCSYHGIALNVAMDLEPFRRINPCGYSNLDVTQLSDLCAVADLEQAKRDLLTALSARLD